MVRFRLAVPTLSVQSFILGIITVLFFQCMTALLNRPKGGIKWGLVAHTVAMFSFATINSAMTLDIQSISYIDNREFSGGDYVSLPGPFGYQFFIFSEAINGVPNIMFFLNQWLADGLLVSSVPKSIIQVSDVSYSSSSTVATLSFPRATGSSPSHA